MGTTALLAVQLRACPTLPEAWHTLAYAHARTAPDGATLLAQLATRLDLPPAIRVQLATERGTAVRAAFLSRADLTPAEVTAALAGETRAGALAALVAANRGSVAVLAGVGAVFTGKPSKVLALALLDADPAAVPVEVAAAVCRFFAARQDPGTSSQVETLLRWAAHLTPALASDLLAVARSTGPAAVRLWLGGLCAVPGLPEADRQALIDTLLVANGRTDETTHRLARLVADLPAAHPLRARVAALVDDPRFKSPFGKILTHQLNLRPRPAPSPLFTSVAADAAAAGDEREALLARLDVPGQARLAATATEPQLLTALARIDDHRVAGQLVTNAVVTDPQLLLAALDVLDGHCGDEPVEELTDLAARIHDPAVLEAALRVDAVSVLPGLDRCALDTAALRAVLADLAAAAASDLTESAWRVEGRRSARPRPARFGAAAIVAAAHVPAEIFDVLPVPLLRYWARRGLECSLHTNDERLPAGRLWAHLAAVQVAVAADPQAWATFDALFAEFTGTLGELTSTLGAVAG